MSTPRSSRASSRKTVRRAHAVARSSYTPAVYAAGPLLVALAYLVGSVSFALIAARRHHVDLRNFGSGNAGATNVGRALGKKAGRIVLLLDALKGALPVFTARLASSMGLLHAASDASGFLASVT